MKLSSFEESDVTTQTPPRAIIGTPYRPYRRGVENAIIGGVCGGLAIRLGVKERTVRIVFSLLALVSGIGVLLYMVLWLSLPRANESESIAQRLVGRHRQLYRIVIALIAIVAIFFVLHSLGMPNLGVYTWPFFLSLLGLVGVWRGASPDELEHLETLIKSAPIIGVASSKSRRNVAFRLVIGALLVFLGLVILHHVGRAWGLATPALLAAVAILGGVLVLFAPWWLATLNDLTGEREARVRIEERANVAAHLHDSVLQTLTLIERAAGDEAAVVRLARTQERELRQWLFDPNYVGDGDARTFSVDAATPGRRDRERLRRSRRARGRGRLPTRTTWSQRSSRRAVKPPSTRPAGRARNTSRSTAKSNRRR